MANNDWYARRHELEPGMVFRCKDGSVVMLDQRTEGDGTKWDVADWNAYAQGWSCEGSTVEPGDLEYEIQNDPDAIAAATNAPESGCDYCRNPLFASLKCPGCGRTATNGGAQ